MGYRIAVVGATGAVGREIIKTLYERRFPVSEIVALASARSVGQEVSFGEKTVLTVKSLEKFDFRGGTSGCSARAPRSAPFMHRARRRRVHRHRQHQPFPHGAGRAAGVPEVNPQALARMRRGIIANPNCSTIQLVVALKPLHDRFKVKRVVVATYQSVSGAGKEGLDELFRQTKGASSTTRWSPSSSPSRSPST